MVARSERRFAALSWASLAVAIAVILWGAYVRASGSGAGCGSHWPLCNGQVLPRAPSEKTLIELGHRVTSGLFGLLVLAQLLWGRRLFPRGHPVRRPLVAAFVLTVVEALIGRSLVLLKYVALDQSVGRAAWMGLHLCNTFFLVAALLLVAQRAGGALAWRPADRPLTALICAAAVLAALATGACGAVAALGDTLFPAKGLAEGLAADLAPAGHWLLKLRATHPFIAVGAAFVILFARQVVQAQRDSRAVASAGLWLRIAVVSQLGVGLLNLISLAPIGLQLGHLAGAQLMWLALIAFVGRALEAEPAHDLVDAEAASASAAMAPSASAKPSG